jgi:hypothetical protein
MPPRAPHDLPLPFPKIAWQSTTPLPKQSGAAPPRAAMVARMRAASQNGDIDSERDASTLLARLCLTRGVHVADAVAILLRSLELAGNADDRPLRLETAAHLAALGRHDEAAELLRTGTPRNEREAMESGLAAGDAAARTGDAGGAAVIYRELAVASLRDARPLERLATIAAWSSAPISEERASDAWLEAASRHGDGDAAHLNLARAFEIAPHNPRAAEAFAAATAMEGRHEAADEILREHGQTSGLVLETARRRLELARASGASMAALGAALDAAIHGMPAAEALATIAALLKDTASSLVRATTGEVFRAIATALLEAMHTSPSSARAEGLLRVADTLRGGARGIVLTLASEAFLEADNRPRAVKLARQACGLAKDSARPRSALLRLGLEEEAALGELEEALGAVAARASTYRMLGRKAARLGRHDLALAFLRRAVVLRPGDSELRQRLLTNLTAALDAVGHEAYGGVLVALATEPYPLLEVAPWIAKAIEALGAHAPKRAAHVGRTILQVAGPLDDLVEPTVRAATASRERRCALEIVALHAVAGGVEDPNRWLRAVDLALPLDPEAAAAHLSQAAANRSEANATRHRLEAVERNLQELSEGARADAIIDLATARAWLSEYHEDAESASERWRELAALRWDLASDSKGAEEALFYACARAPRDGLATYCAELVERGGIELALERIRQRVALLDDAEDSRLAGALLAGAASLAFESGRTDLAVALGLDALGRECPPLSSLQTLDAAAEHLVGRDAVSEGLSVVERTYKTLADRAAGVRGAHAAYYRGSRLLESLGAEREALTFALRALQRSRTQGASFELVRRLVEHQREAGRSVEALDEAFDTLRHSARSDAHRGEVDALRKKVFVALDVEDPGSAIERGYAPPPSSRRGSSTGTLQPNAVPSLEALPALEAGPSQAVRTASPSSAPLDANLEDSSDFPAMLRNPKRAESAVQERTASEPTEWSLWERGSNLSLTEAEGALERDEAFQELAVRLGARLDKEQGPTQALLRLRRAAIFEAKLNDRSAARAELEALLAESDGPDIDALRHLARLHEDDGQTLNAARCWERIVHEASRAGDLAQAAVRACEAFLDAGEPNLADSVLRAVRELPGTPDLVLMRLAVASALAGDGDDELPDFELDPTDELSGPSSDDLHAFGIGGDTRFGNINRLRRNFLASAPAPDSVDHDEIELLQEELENGEYEAGEQLVAIFRGSPERFSKEVIDVRRAQARIRPGDVATLNKFLSAVREGGGAHHADAIEHVLFVFQGNPAPQAPRLEELPSRSESTVRLLLGHLEGTVSDALSIVCRAGLYRTEDARAALDGCDLVTPGAPTTLGRIHGALQRLWQLEGVRLYHRQVRGPLGYRVELLSPVSAFVHGTAEEPTPALTFIVGSALAAATPACAYAEALSASELETFLRGLLAAFGPVDTDAAAVKTVEVAQLAQELWGIIRGADERKVRELCYEPTRVTAGVARLDAGRARRRAGLFACGDLLTALVQTAAELGMSTSVPFADPDGLRELCAHPSLSNLVDMALDETYAASRWRRATMPPPGGTSPARASARPGAR